MNAQSENEINFSYLMSGYDLMESAGKYWMDAIKRFLPETAQEDFKESMPGMNIIRPWQQWYVGCLEAGNRSSAEIPVLGKACIDRQQRCAELALTWWKCYMKAFRIIGAGRHHSEHLAQIMKECMALSEECIRFYADYLAAETEKNFPYTALSYRLSRRTSRKNKKLAKTRAS